MRNRLIAGVVVMSLVPLLFSCGKGESIPEVPVAPCEDAAAAVAAMGIGTNLCDTFENGLNYKARGATREDPVSFETLNKRSKTTFQTMRGFKDAGFNSIRIPITWYPHMDDTKATIDKVWLERIAEVVNYAISNNMYCIINVHHDAGSTDGAWLFADPSTYEDKSCRLCNIWRQVAEYFKDYSDKLLFESYNEILEECRKWTVPMDQAAFGTANQLNQDFVNTVRATGGRNATRNLVVSTFSSGASATTLENFTLPKDNVAGHLIAKFHSYVPQKVCTAKADHRDYVDADEPEIDNLFETVSKYILSKGYPCILGEYGIYPRPSETNNAQMRGHHAYKFTIKALQHGIAPMYWYNPMDYQQRSAGTFTYPELKDSLVKAYNDFLAGKK